jgi:hypothetical protein
LREVLRAYQRDGYAVLMQASAAAIIELARACVLTLLGQASAFGLAPQDHGDDA